MREFKVGDIVRKTRNTSAQDWHYEMRVTEIRDDTLRGVITKEGPNNIRLFSVGVVGHSFKDSYDRVTPAVDTKSELQAAIDKCEADLAAAKDALAKYQLADLKPGETFRFQKETFRFQNHTSAAQLNTFVGIVGDLFVYKSAAGTPLACAMSSLTNNWPIRADA